MPEAFVLETLRTARTDASPRAGFASISPVDLLVSLQHGAAAVSGAAGLGVAVLVERVS
jgi:hypothetical protein